MNTFTAKAVIGTILVGAAILIVADLTLGWIRSMRAKAAAAAATAPAAE